MSTTIMIIRFETQLTPTGDAAEGLGRIVVPLDGSELARRALVPAEELARRTGAALELVSTKVLDGPTQPSSFLDDLADEIIERSSPIDVRTSIRMEADPVAAIQAVVDQDAVQTVVVMSSHGRGRLRRAGLGSTAEQVVASVQAPVLITGPSFTPGTFSAEGPIVVAHDGEHQPDLEAIAWLARTTGGQITLLEVFHPPSPALGGPPPQSVVSDTAADCAGRLRAMGFEVVTEAEQALQTHKVIVDVAEDLAASYVVVTSRARTGVSRAVLGSVASAVVRSSSIPVLVNRAH